MFTLNETAADLAGRELGDMAFVRMGGDLNESPSRYLPQGERDPAFTSAMRETRLRVEELLEQGKIEEAEQYMKERWWLLRLAGYRLRKLNQAYFAFHGRYAEGPASVSPIGRQINELRSLLPDVGAFVKTVSGMSNGQELLDLLERLRAQSAGDRKERSMLSPVPSAVPVHCLRGAIQPRMTTLPWVASIRASGEDELGLGVACRLWHAVGGVNYTTRG
jgi:hypothetical protein